jgi:hypothetical protein
MIRSGLPTYRQPVEACLGPYVDESSGSPFSGVSPKTSNRFPGSAAVIKGAYSALNQRGTGHGMVATVGQLAAQAAKEIVKRIFKAPDSEISESDIATVVRQNFIGRSNTSIIIAPGKTSTSDSDETMLLVAHRCMELLARLDGIEVTFTVGPDWRSISIRRIKGNVREETLLRALDQAAGGLHPQPVTVPIAASSLTDGHMEVFTLVDHRRLRHRWYWPDPNWSGWHDMPLPAGRVTAIAAGSKDDYHQEVAVAVWDTVHHCWWTGKDDGWSAWQAMPPLVTPVIDLAFSSNIADALEVYALDEKGRIWHRWWWRDSGWSNGWTLMGTPGGRPVTAIAAGSYADYHQELFAIVNGEIWHRWWWRNDGWSDWHQQAAIGMHATDIAVSSLKEGHLEVFALNEGGRGLRHRWYWAGHGWSSWEDFPVPDGSPLTAIAAVSGSMRHQEIFGRKGSGKIVHAWNWLSDDGKPDWESWSEWSKWHWMPDVS